MNSKKTNSKKPFPAVSDIDFLPKRYQEDYANRKTRSWKIVFLLVFVAALPTASIYQYRMRCSIQKQLDQLAEVHAQSLADQVRLDHMQLQLTNGTARANLLTYLRHNWPTSQWMAGIVDPLPDTITLEEIAMSLSQESRAVPFRRGQPEQEESDAEGRLGAENDLIEIRKQRNGRLVVQLTGRTTNSTQLHHYLAQLAKSPWFDEAVLESIESNSSDQKDVASSRFEAVLVVAASYGQPGGPIGSSPDDPHQSAANAQTAESPGRGEDPVITKFIGGQPS